ncbi:NAD-dependent succinate-semialdehyde dehydrogenase [Agrobacterium tumefaciens]|uniref:NAD-dependent succinate-semialdehyde dehydrogenase n=1 Tax=Agrobacterium tumefaciens TaxID=358 RepID=A0AAP9EB82_AGRTU|nr:NAD-dependent succinate-semialdehyde dehydrogenase [Agrobacterium tumefaciens]NSZ60141.1 NAD-dependent succinate-semialdehyde dehydrogenase [Agrobacterium tumefaciens]QDY97736.1 NAD-dependent succinate-semialdehyde dehydrogenase [Agrobacterium tumefaciens]UXS12859.1 NAD-dependent succinate-semialdehyde dehydrogenase [Agrobacterium tumefaciens]UXS20221.1 NAD-dependent succinate-semialdehyde dehydrogenase [Agrobacterium tumefaciens]UXS27867.1 NAD-dependent succinate-semialdehyde dehydrogenase
MYDELYLYIDGTWIDGGGRHQEAVLDPATNRTLGHLPRATTDDLDRAVEAAHRAFLAWRDVSPLERSNVLRRAATLLRERNAEIDRQITLDQGKPLAEAIGEVNAAADSLAWHAEEGRRVYGRIVPARNPFVRQTILRQPVGVCAAFTPWNFPIMQAVQKVAAALTTGCTVVLKGPEDSPSGVVALARALHDAGLPHGCLNLVWGVPGKVSEYLVPHPLVRKISFTGSVAVGKQLASLAGLHMKRSTMELGGHAPVLIFDDCNLEHAVALLADRKIRNAGQACGAPTRFYVQDKVFEQFSELFTRRLQAIRVGAGTVPETEMGPLCHGRRLDAMKAFVADAKSSGADILLGGEQSGKEGNFFQPTVIANPSASSRIMTEEPFGPVATLLPFNTFDEVIERANSLPYGLSSFVFTGSADIAQEAGRQLEAGAVNINHIGVGLPEIPFGGVKDSGYGSEGGQESLDGYLTTKVLTQLAVSDHLRR